MSRLKLKMFVCCTQFRIFNLNLSLLSKGRCISIVVKYINGCILNVLTELLAVDSLLVWLVPGIEIAKPKYTICLILSCRLQNILSFVLRS